VIIVSISISIAFSDHFVLITRSHVLLPVFGNRIVMMDIKKE